MCRIPLTSDFILACRTLILLRYFRIFLYNLTRLCPAGDGILYYKIYPGTAHKRHQMLLLVLFNVFLLRVFLFTFVE